MRSIVLLWCLVLAACGGKQSQVALPTRTLDVLLIPGCPSQEDGRLTGCQWQRAVWGAYLYDQGVARYVMTSGNAVQNPYIEAEAVAAGLVALGVPRDVILTETQALHSDENAAYGLLIMQELGLQTLGVASHGGHATGIRSMVRGWGYPCDAFPMEQEVVRSRMHAGLPDVRTQPVLLDEWLPLREREKVIKERTGKGRGPSWWVYFAMSFRGSFGKVTPPVPPVPEPTLAGQRYRVDTRPWPVEDEAAAAD